MAYRWVPESVTPLGINSGLTISRRRFAAGFGCAQHVDECERVEVLPVSFLTGKAVKRKSPVNQGRGDRGERRVGLPSGRGAPVALPKARDWFYDGFCFAALTKPRFHATRNKNKFLHHVALSIGDEVG